MRYGITILAAFALLASVQTVSGQQDRKLIRQGNEAYESGNYRDAEIHYRKGLERNPVTEGGAYNLGNSLYRQESFSEAAQQYERAIASMADPLTTAKAYHNLGNAQVKEGKLKEAIEAYKQALRLNPADEDTRYNLSWAQRRMQQQQQEQGQEQEQDEGQGQDKGKQQEQQQQQQQKQQQQMSKQDAERMLQALRQDEQRTLDKVKRQMIQAERQRIEKDW